MPGDAAAEEQAAPAAPAEPKCLALVSFTCVDLNLQNNTYTGLYLCDLSPTQKDESALRKLFGILEKHGECDSTERRFKLPWDKLTPKGSEEPEDELSGNTTTFRITNLKVIRNLNKVTRTELQMLLCFYTGYHVNTFEKYEADELPQLAPVGDYIRDTVIMGKKISWELVNSGDVICENDTAKTSTLAQIGGFFWQCFLYLFLCADGQSQTVMLPTDVTAYEKEISPGDQTGKKTSQIAILENKRKEEVEKFNHAPLSEKCKGFWTIMADECIYERDDDGKLCLLITASDFAQRVRINNRPLTYTWILYLLFNVMRQILTTWDLRKNKDGFEKPRAKGHLLCTELKAHGSSLPIMMPLIIYTWEHVLAKGLAATRLRNDINMPFYTKIPKAGLPCCPAYIAGVLTGRPMLLPPECGTQPLLTFVAVYNTQPDEASRIVVATSTSKTEEDPSKETPKVQITVTATDNTGCNLLSPTPQQYSDARPKDALIQFIRKLVASMAAEYKSLSKDGGGPGIACLLDFRSIEKSELYNFVKDCLLLSPDQQDNVTNYVEDIKFALELMAQHLVLFDYNPLGRFLDMSNHSNVTNEAVYAEANDNEDAEDEELEEDDELFEEGIEVDDERYAIEILNAEITWDVSAAKRGFRKTLLSLVTIATDPVTQSQKMLIDFWHLIQIALPCTGLLSFFYSNNSTVKILYRRLSAESIEHMLIEIRKHMCPNFDFTKAEEKLKEQGLTEGEHEQAISDLHDRAKLQAAFIEEYKALMEAVEKFLGVCKRMAIWNVHHDCARLVQMQGTKAASSDCVIRLESKEIATATQFWLGLMLKDLSQPKESQEMHNKNLFEFLQQATKWMETVMAENNRSCDLTSPVYIFEFLKRLNKTNLNAAFFSAFSISPNSIISNVVPGKCAKIKSSLLGEDLDRHCFHRNDEWIRDLRILLENLPRNPTVQKDDVSKPDAQIDDKDYDFDNEIACLESLLEQLRVFNDLWDAMYNLHVAEVRCAAQNTCAVDADKSVVESLNKIEERFLQEIWETFSCLTKHETLIERLEPDSMLYRGLKLVKESDDTVQLTNGTTETSNEIAPIIDGKFLLELLISHRDSVPVDMLLSVPSLETNASKTSTDDEEFGEVDEHPDDDIPDDEAGDDQAVDDEGALSNSEMFDAKLTFQIALGMQEIFSQQEASLLGFFEYYLSVFDSTNMRNRCVRDDDPETQQQQRNFVIALRIGKEFVVKSEILIKQLQEECGDLEDLTKIEAAVTGFRAEYHVELVQYTEMIICLILMITFSGSWSYYISRLNSQVDGKAIVEQMLQVLDTLAEQDTNDDEVSGNETVEIEEAAFEADELPNVLH